MTLNESRFARRTRAMSDLRENDEGRSRRDPEVNVNSREEEDANRRYPDRRRADPFVCEDEEEEKNMKKSDRLRVRFSRETKTIARRGVYITINMNIKYQYIYISYIYILYIIYKYINVWL